MRVSAARGPDPARYVPNRALESLAHKNSMWRFGWPGALGGKVLANPNFYQLLPDLGAPAESICR